jgi:hypothetical protein
MADEDWRMGSSLDALDDVLHRFDRGDGPSVVLEWRDHARSREALGVPATRAWLAAKLERPGFDTARIQRQLDALDAGTGPTYFELVLQVIADHPGVRLELR